MSLNISGQNAAFRLWTPSAPRTPMVKTRAKLIICSHYTACDHFFIQTPAAINRHIGLSHRYSQLGDVAS